MVSWQSCCRKLDDNPVDEQLRAAIKGFCMGLTAAINKYYVRALVLHVLITAAFQPYFAVHTVDASLPIVLLDLAPQAQYAAVCT